MLDTSGHTGQVGKASLTEKKKIFRKTFSQPEYSEDVRAIGWPTGTNKKGGIT